jgi:hypothetical protein
MGCRTTVPVASPARDLARAQPRTLLLTDTDQSVVRLTAASLMGDTVVGRVEGRRTAIPLSRVTAVREVVISPTRTAALAAVLGGAAVVVWLHLWNDDEGACAGIERIGPNGEDLGGCCAPC